MADSKPPKRDLNSILNEFNNSHLDTRSRALQFICIPLLSFGLLGFVWSLPFPQLGFLGRYNGFVNWASFLIAISIYYYLKLSPLLSYGLLLIVFAFSAGIVGLEKMHTNNGWPTMGTVCLGVFMLGLILQFIAYRYEAKLPSLKDNLRSFVTGPLWLMYQLFSYFGIKTQ